uniref:Anaphase-promoting complex subunit 2 n=1 Tax=Spongospora subterranea TaxID=70186 RepID=A0A0H5QKR2_9EUKA|eukprot:CRZ02598.1 hypothetical protein [Spongospora subterranea]
MTSTVSGAFQALATLNFKSSAASEAAVTLASHGQSQVFIDWYFGNIQERIAQVAETAFWNRLKPFSQCDDPNQICDAFYIALDETVRLLRPLLSTIQGIDELLPSSLFRPEGTDFTKQHTERYFGLVHAVFFSSIPDWFTPFMVTFFSLQFTSWSESLERPITSTMTSHHLERFLSQVCPELQELCWIPVLEFGVTAALLEQIERRAQKECSGQYELPVLPGLLDWLNTSVFTWVGALYNPDSLDCKRFASRLTFFLYERVGDLRIREMFDIIVDFPDSTGAVTDLAQCLLNTDQQSLLVSSLVATFDKRLLHPGAMTRDIVTQYISCFRVMRIIDPSGLILTSIVDPICAYLKTRPDAVKVVVAALINGNEPYGLLAELERSADDHESVRCSIDNDFGYENDDEGVAWEPEPVVTFGEAVEPVLSASSWSLRKSNNVLSQLVYIFGSSDQLIEEYINLLAERLMKLPDYNTEREVHHLELLKQRFGEAQFRCSDVMIADISMSKRINANIQKTINSPNFPLSCTIISHEFWPKFSDSDIDASVVLPSVILHSMKEYSQHYEVLKAPRELVWKSSLGNADLTLTFNDGRQVFVSDVSSGHAAVLFAFNDLDAGAELSLQSVCDAVQMSPASVRRRLHFWVQKRVLAQNGSGSYSVLEYADHMTSSPTSLQCDDDDEDDESTAFSVEAQQREASKLLESYILGILPSSFGGFTLSRIDSILRSAFTSGSTSYSRSENELHEFLEQLVHEGKLECVDGLYKQSPKVSFH